MRRQAEGFSFTAHKGFAVYYRREKTWEATFG